LPRIIAFDLALQRQRIDRPPDVMRTDDLQALDLTVSRSTSTSAACVA